MPDSSESFQITVGVPRALEILGGNVFAGPQCCFRELVANTADSISERPGRLQQHAAIRKREDWDEDGQ
jgi:HSP90 family molecular chaperone